MERHDIKISNYFSVAVPDEGQSLVRKLAQYDLF
jgi:hypothetical protein